MVPGERVAQGVLDRAALLARIGDDPELLRELVGIFLEDCPGWLEQIRAGVRQVDARRLKLYAHLLSGTAANFGAHDVTAAARRLELMGQSGQLDGAPEALADLVVAIDQLTPALHQLAVEKN
jgi:two-component system, sensor histidine kinase and response regulator